MSPVRSKPIVCSRCGKKIGKITIKPAFNKKIITRIVLLSVGIQVIAQIVAQILIPQSWHLF